MKTNLKILRTFTILSLAATVVVAVGLGTIASSMLSRNLLQREVQTTAEGLRALTNADLPAEEFRRAVRAHDAETFEYIWGYLLEVPDVFHARIYEPPGRAVWADEPGLLGRRDPNNLELAQALRGELMARLAPARSEHATGQELAPEGQSLELYVPLVTPDSKRVYAVVEVRKYAQTFLAKRRYWRAAVWAGAMGGGLVTFLLLFWLFRRALKEQDRLHRTDEDYAAISAEMKLAASIQARVLLRELPCLPGFTLAAFYQPSRELGGDHYDASLRPDGSLWLSIADGEGKGIPAALLMMETRAAIQARSETVEHVGEVFRLVNRTLAGSGERSSFVTAILMKINSAAPALTYCNAGHPPAFLVRQGKLIALDKGGTPLGADADAIYEEEALPLEPGDVLFMYTDGVTEAENAQGQFFGVERLSDVLLKTAPGGSPKTIIETMRTAVEAFRGGFEYRDDMAMLCMVVASVPQTEGQGANNG